MAGEDRFAGLIPARDTTLGPEWEWRCTLIYRNDVPPPQIGGEVAIQTVHQTLSSRDMEISAGQAREDIGRIVVEQRIRDEVTLRPPMRNSWRQVMTWTRDPASAAGWLHS